MGYFLLIATGLIGPFLLIRYREAVGDMIGEADWMRKVGGVYKVVLIVALVLFFWTLAELTGTTTVLFGPLRNFLPGLQPQAPANF